MSTKTKEAPAPARQRKTGGKVVLYALIEGEQQQALRVLAFMRQVPMADLVREAIDNYLQAKGPTTADVEGVVKQLRRSVRSR
jgi:hypothetical protein